MNTRQKSHRCGFDISLHAADLPGEEKALLGTQLKAFFQQRRGIQKGVSVNASITGKFDLFQAGNHSQDTPLFGPCHLGLKSDDVVLNSRKVFAAELYHRVRLLTGFGVDQTDRLHRSMGKGLDPALRDYLNRKTSFKTFDVLKRLGRNLLRGHQAFPERLIGFAVHWTVQVIRLAVAVARGLEDPVKIDGFPFDNRGNGIVKVEGIPTCPGGNGPGESVAGQRSGCEDDYPLSGNVRNLGMHHLQAGLAKEHFFHNQREGFPVDRKCIPGRHGRHVGCCHDQ